VPSSVIERAGLHLQDRRPQSQVELGQQVQRHHRRRAEVGFEDVALDDAHTLAELFGLHVTLSEPCELRVVFDTDGLCAEVPGGGNGDLAVACAEVVDAVGGGDVRHLQHPRDQGVVGRHPDDILAGLAGLRGELTFAFLATCAGRGERTGEQQGE
jgi:hypothetical protein